MGTAGRMTGPASEPGPPPHVARDVRLTRDDRRTLLEAVANLNLSEQEAHELLRSIDFPAAYFPAWGRPIDWWGLIFRDFDDGRSPEPYRRLLTLLSRNWTGNETLVSLYHEYVSQTRTPESIEDTCQVMVGARSEAERQSTRALLQSLGLDPRETLSTAHVISFATNTPDPQRVRTLLNGRDLPWTVVPPGAPNYVLRNLFVQGPDGTRFRLVDTPIHQTFSNIANEVLTDQYPAGDSVASRPTVMNRFRGDNQSPERINDPDQTLYDADVRDGEQLQIAAESRAGQINPTDHEAGLIRAYRSITQYCTENGYQVEPNRELIATEYDMWFNQKSFGPPEPPDGEPVLITQHQVRIELGPGFPVVRPDVFWVTPIFHPNVFPNYDCELSREKKWARGLVCLGTLADSWYAGIDASELCRTIVDIAGFRNYDVIDFSDVAGYGPRLNFYDEAAARWAFTHQAEINDIGGIPLFPLRRDRPTVIRNVIQRLG
jgi:hypothetical protein